MKKSLNTLKLAVDKCYQMTLEEWKDFSSIWQLIGYAKKEVISKPQTIENYYYFNLSGLQQLVYNNEAGKETTIELTYENCFGGNLTSLLLRKPAYTSYVAISRSRLLRCSYTDLSKLFDTHFGIATYFRLQLAQKLEAYIEHLVVVKSFSAVAKYNAFVLNTNFMSQKVPQKYIANHLGLDATNYSKIKRQRYAILK